MLYLVDTSIQEAQGFLFTYYQTQVALYEMSPFDDSYWQFIERRSSKIPTNWSDRLCFTQYLELLATLHVCISLMCT